MPDDARCLMEEVAWRAGEPVGDRPGATHPVLALLAQQIHDRSSSAAREVLLAQVSALTGARSRDPRVGWALVGVCARRALAEDLPARVRRVAARLARRADRRTARASPTARWLRRAGPAAAVRAVGPLVALARLGDVALALRCVLAAAGPAGSPGRDRALADVLAAATAAVRALDAPGAAETTMAVTRPRDRLLSPG